MTKKEAKRRAELYSALADGKAIQVQNLITGKWEYLDINKIDEFMEEFNYRIEPEPKYRPFKSQEECWNEMLKHQPFGWLKEKANKKEMAHIGRIFDIPNDSLITLSSDEGHNYSSSYFFRTYTFADGVPFGIKEE